MAKEYFEQLINLVESLNIKAETSKDIKVKHFFSGAALYVNGRICASLTPVGLAFKLTEKEVAEEISKGKAVPLKYFPKGHIKKDYVLFEAPDLTKIKRWKKYFNKVIQLE